MTKQPPEGAASRFWESLADSLDELSDAELLAELRESGEDPEALALSARAVLRDAVKRVRQRALIDARRNYLDAVRLFDSQVPNLPQTISAKRQLLVSVFARRPELLTLQFRDLTRVSDEDVEGMLRQMALLGVLDDFQES
jgi:hypothetical protein